MVCDSINILDKKDKLRFAYYVSGNYNIMSGEFYVF